MKNVASGLARYGRYGDNNLVHVSNKELAGLEQLTGRRFTKNPHTGLPEAFGWVDLIPIAAGVVGTVASGFNPAVGALAAGAARTGVSASQGKSTEQALMEGVVAGATTYAGGQLLSGVGEAGVGAATPGVVGETASAAATPVAGEAAGAIAPGVGEAAVTPAATEAVGAAAPGVGETAAATQAPGSSTGWGANQMQPANGGQLNFSPATANTGPTYPDLTPSEVSAAKTPEPTFGERMSTNFDKGMARAENVYDNPGTATGKVGENVWNDPKSAAVFAGGTYAQTSGLLEPAKNTLGEKEPYDPNRYPERFPSQTRQWNGPSSDYQPGYSAEYRYFAKGGLADLRSSNQETTANLMNEAKAALLGEHPKPQEAIERFRNVMGDDAFMALKDRITGGRIRGAGGGLDDLVPGSIEGRQKVRLADGEFVLPAPIVSAIGDGSTDQGARRLHEMMDSIYKQKYKSKGLPQRLKEGTLIDEQG